MKSKNSPEALIKKVLELDVLEFLGICKIVGVDVYEQVDVETDVDDGQSSNDSKNNAVPREFEDIWCDLCDAIAIMNRVRRRNLGKLIYAATKKEKEK